MKSSLAGCFPIPRKLNYCRDNSVCEPQGPVGHGDSAMCSNRSQSTETVCMHATPTASKGSPGRSGWGTTGGVSHLPSEPVAAQQCDDSCSSGMLQYSRDCAKCFKTSPNLIFSYLGKYHFPFIQENLEQSEGPCSRSQGSSCR